MRQHTASIVSRAAVVAGALGLLAGCGLPFGHAAKSSAPPSSAAPATPAQRPGYATDGTPITVATLQAQYGKLFPGLVFRPGLFGAPAKPPFSLAAYPPQHAITWKGIDPNSLPAWERDGAETAAKWLMAWQGNHELTSLQYIAPMAAAPPNPHGVRTLQEAALYDIAQNFAFAKKIGGAYEYLTYSQISAVQPPPVQAFEKEYATLLPANEQPTHMVVVRVAVFQVSTGGGGYGYSETGPGTVIAVDLPNAGWRVLSWSSFPAKQIHVFKAHFHETPLQ
ncbi:MAG: hypothetical protein K6U87_06995 [Firmicutes bacterium]|nr:hypothetical protein [Bacillota bacterium]